MTVCKDEELLTMSVALSSAAESLIATCTNEANRCYLRVCSEYKSLLDNKHCFLMSNHSLISVFNETYIQGYLSEEMVLFQREMYTRKCA